MAITGLGAIGFQVARRLVDVAPRATPTKMAQIRPALGIGRPRTKASARSADPARRARMVAKVRCGANGIPVVINGKQIAHSNITRMIIRTSDIFTDSVFLCVSLSISLLMCIYRPMGRDRVRACTHQQASHRPFNQAIGATIKQ